MPAGRPPKYDPKFCDVVIKMGEEGAWVAEMAEACDVHRSTIEDWAKKHSEFSAALTRAKQKAKAWFERKGREGMFDKNFNATMWKNQVSSRHPEDYTEKKEVKHGVAQDNTDELELSFTISGKKVGKAAKKNRSTRKDS